MSTDSAQTQVLEIDEQRLENAYDNIKSLRECELKATQEKSILARIFIPSLGAVSIYLIYLTIAADSNAIHPVSKGVVVFFIILLIFIAPSGLTFTIIDDKRTTAVHKKWKHKLNIYERRDIKILQEVMHGYSSLGEINVETLFQFSCATCGSTKLLWKSYKNFRMNTAIKCAKCGSILYIPKYKLCPVCGKIHEILILNDDDNTAPKAVPLPKSIEGQSDDRMASFYAGFLLGGLPLATYMKTLEWFNQRKEQKELIDAIQEYEENKHQYVKVKLHYELGCKNVAGDPNRMGFRLPTIAKRALYRKVIRFVEQKKLTANNSVDPTRNTPVESGND